MKIFPFIFRISTPSVVGLAVSFFVGMGLAVSLENQKTSETKKQSVTVECSAIKDTGKIEQKTGLHIFDCAK